MFRIKRWIFVFLTTLAALISQSGHAGHHVEILETYPPGQEITLNRNQNFYIHFSYDSDEPIRIWAEPYFHGKPANAGSNPSNAYTGNGEALGWFFFQAPNTQVDEIRVNVGDGSIDGTHTDIIYPVQIHNTEQLANSYTDPEWVTRLKKRDQAIQLQSYKTHMNSPISMGEQVLFSGFMLLMLALGFISLAAPIWAFRKWHGLWRMTTLVPIAVMLFIIFRLLIDTSHDPTSHNLWPFEIIIGCVFNMMIMAILLIIRKIMKA